MVLAIIVNYPLLQITTASVAKQKEKKEMISGYFVGIAERGGRTRNLEIKSLTLYRLS